MARQISEYGITFPYGATSAPYSSAHPHRGNDLPLRYEPIVIGDTQIGISGASGWADGPHCHVQAGYDLWCQNTLNSAPYIGRAGTVVRTGTADQWGSYVIVQTSGVFVAYCHMSRIDVGVGKVINEQRRFTMDNNDGRDIYKYVFHRDPENDSVTGQWNGKKFSDIDFSTAGEWQAIDHKVRDYDNVSQQVRDRDNTIASLRSELAVRQDTINQLNADADKLRAQVSEPRPAVTLQAPSVFTTTPTNAVPEKPSVKPQAPKLNIFQHILLAFAKSYNSRKK